MEFVTITCFHTLDKCCAAGCVQMKVRAWNVFSSLEVAVGLPASCGTDLVDVVKCCLNETEVVFFNSLVISSHDTW